MSAPTLTIDGLAVANVISVINTIVAGATVTTVDGVFPYQTTLVAKLYEADGGEGLVEGTAHIMQGKDLPLPSQPYRKDDFWVPLVVCCPATARRNASSDRPSVEDKLRQFNADVRLALGQDLHRGGYAITTQFIGESVYDVDTEPPTVAIPVRLHIRTAVNNRYSK